MIVSSFWGIVFYIRNIILLALTTKKTLLTLQSMAAVPDFEPVESLSIPVGIQVYKY